MTRLVAVGCSWGGLRALATVLDRVPDDLDASIVIAQHRAPGRSNLAKMLAAHTQWPVAEAEDKQSIVAGRVYLAPPGYHLLVQGEHFTLSTEGMVQHSRPSIDVLFESVADAYTERAVAIILTGANTDGAAGVVRIARRGGLVIVQDPDTAERREMPDAALASGVDAVVATLADIGPLLARVMAEP